MVGEPTGGTTLDAWRSVTEEVARLGSSLRAHYVNHGRPDVLEELREAVHDLALAATRVGSSAAAAMRDPGVQEQMRETFKALLAALTTTVDNVRSDLAEQDGG